MSDSKKPTPFRIEEPSGVPLRHIEDTGERYHGPHGRPTRMKKSKLNEIRARSQEIQERFRRVNRSNLSSFNQGLLVDTPYLLDLAERMGKVMEELLQDDYTKHMRRDDVREARALLEEIDK